jgi:3-phosphoglycerate kinase
MTYLSRAKELGVDILLPTDVVVASAFADDAKTVVTTVDAIDLDLLFFWLCILQRSFEQVELD